MPFDVRLPDGRVIRNVPDGTTKAQIMAKLGRVQPTPSDLVASIPGNSAPVVSRRPAPALGQRAVGAGEAALTAVTGATGGTVGLVGGTVGGIAGAVRSGRFGTAEGARDVERAATNAAARLTYAPRTETGQRYAENVGNAIAQTAPLVPMSVELAAVGRNALLAAPVLRARVAAAGFQVREQAQRRAEFARTEPSVDNPEIRVPPEVAARQRAEAYAARNLGTPLGDLPAEIRAQIETVARDAQALEALDPAAVRRQATLGSLPVPVPATRGQLTRNLPQIKREENIRATDLGEPLMDIMARQDEALAGNLQAMRGRAQATTPQQYGQSVQGALTEKQAALRSASNKLFEQAREQGAMAAPVDTAALDKWLKVPANEANAGWIAGRLNTYRGAPDGPISINDLELLRSEASKASFEGGRAGFFAGEAVKVIDDILDGVDGPYRTARQSWRAMKQEFTAQALVDKLTNKKRGSLDRRVALEDTIDTVLRGSAEQIASLRHSLLTGGTAQTRMQGLQAWRDVRGGVINRLRERAMNSRGDGIEGTAGQSQFNGTAFLKEFDALDADGVLAEMFTTKELGQLRALREAVQTTRTTPSGRFSGSDTTPRLLSLLEKFGNHMPIGDIGRGIMRKGIELHEQGQAVRRVQEAATPPLTEAAARVARRKPLKP